MILTEDELVEKAGSLLEEMLEQRQAQISDPYFTDYMITDKIPMEAVIIRGRMKENGDSLDLNLSAAGCASSSPGT